MAHRYQEVSKDGRNLFLVGFFHPSNSGMTSVDPPVKGSGSFHDKQTFKSIFYPWLPTQGHGASMQVLFCSDHFKKQFGEANTEGQCVSHKKKGGHVNITAKLKKHRAWGSNGTADISVLESGPVPMWYSEYPFPVPWPH